MAPAQEFDANEEAFKILDQYQTGCAFSHRAVVALRFSHITRVQPCLADRVLVRHGTGGLPASLALPKRSLGAWHAKRAQHLLTDQQCCLTLQPHVCVCLQVRGDERSEAPAAADARRGSRESATAHAYSMLGAKPSPAAHAAHAPQQLLARGCDRVCASRLPSCAICITWSACRLVRCWLCCCLSAHNQWQASCLRDL